MKSVSSEQHQNLHTQQSQLTSQQQSSQSTQQFINPHKSHPNFPPNMMVLQQQQQQQQQQQLQPPQSQLLPVPGPMQMPVHVPMQMSMQIPFQVHPSYLVPPQQPQLYSINMQQIPIQHHPQQLPQQQSQPSSQQQQISPTPPPPLPPHSHPSQQVYYSQPLIHQAQQLQQPHQYMQFSQQPQHYMQFSQSSPDFLRSQQQSSNQIQPQIQSTPLIPRIPQNSQQMQQIQQIQQIHQIQQIQPHYLIPSNPSNSDNSITLEKQPKKVQKLTSFKVKPQKKISAFVSKLYSMLHDPELSHLIWWSRINQNDFTTFALLPGSEFATCLSTYFKHGNVASFVRQLHMYGFHKVCESNYQQQQQQLQQHLNNNLNNNQLHSNQNSNQPVWEFRHSSGKFRRGDQNHLFLIRRRAYSRRNSGDQNKSDIATDNEISDKTNISNINKIDNEIENNENSNEFIDENNNNISKQPKIKYSPVYFKDNEKDLSNDKEIIESSKLENKNNSNFRVPTPKQDLKLFRPSSAGRISPVLYKQNVFSQKPRERYHSIFVDPCAPAPTSNPIQDSNSSVHLPCINNDSNPSNSSNNLKLPSISSISSQSSNSLLASSRNSSLNSVGNQLRPSLFDLHNGNSSTTTSIFSGSSVSSVTSSGSRIGSSISSILNENNRRTSSLTSNAPLPSSSLKSILSHVTPSDDSPSTGRTSRSSSDEIETITNDNENINDIKKNTNDEINQPKIEN